MIHLISLYVFFNMVGVGGQMEKFNIEVYGHLQNTCPIVTKSSRKLPDHSYTTHAKFERDRGQSVEIQAKNACRTQTSKK